MGTNYYLAGSELSLIYDDSPEVHIGKRSNAGGSNMVFIWAMHPEDAQRKINEAGGVINTYGEEFSEAEFFHDIIRSCCIQDDRSIGQRFC